MGWVFCLAASLPPADLKKLRAQQRKAAKKAEQEKQEKMLQERREREQREREQRESHHQKRPHNQQDKEADAPPADDLQPQKLARVSHLKSDDDDDDCFLMSCHFLQVEDPLEQAIKFLQPLQQWGSNYIETHLLAFEVYFRKGKPLLMLQSVKRALKLDSGHPQLHSCLIRLLRFLTDGDLLNEKVSHPALASVLASETKPLFQNHKDAQQLNSEFLKQNSNSLPHLLQGIVKYAATFVLPRQISLLTITIVFYLAAKMMVTIDPLREDEALSIVNRPFSDLQGVTVQVRNKFIHF